MSILFVGFFVIFGHFMVVLTVAKIPPTTDEVGGVQRPQQSF